MPRRGEIVTTGEYRKPPLPPGVLTAADGRALNGYVLEEQVWTNLETGETELRKRPVPPEERRCTKITNSATSPWKGNRCAGQRIKGHYVCLAHGGRLQSVKKAAARRLAMAAMPALEKMIDIALYKPGVADADRIRAIAQILDRAGVTGKTEITVELKPWQDMLSRIAGVLPEKSAEDDEDNPLEGEWWEESDDEHSRTAPRTAVARKGQASKRQSRSSR